MAPQPIRREFLVRSPTAAARMRASLRRSLRNEHIILSILALVVGAMVGFAAVWFRFAIGSFQLLGFGFSHELVVSGVAGLPWWRILLVPTAGGLAIGLFAHWALRGKQVEGVAHVIEANALKGGRMEPRSGALMALVHAASLGVGASTGREGPVVHLGATLGAILAERLHLGPGLSRTLLGCGVAAGVAASFNAPIAGVFFALEVVVGHHALKALAPIVVASVTGTVISREVFGNAPAFLVPENYIVSLWEFPAFALLGLVCALAAIIFMSSIFVTQRAFERSRVPVWLRPAVGGLALGAIALAFPQVLGVGYEATDAGIGAAYGFALLLALIVAKTAATSISLGAGFGGGVFSPSLFLGAMVGGAFGIVAESAFPFLYSGTSAYAMIGMGALAGAVLGAPMSTILIIFELTADYQIAIAVMVATVVASVVTNQFYGRSFFHKQLEARGIRLGAELGLLAGLKVGDVMREAFVAVPADCGVDVMRAKLAEAPYGELFVVAEDGRLLGVITYPDLQHALARDGAAAPCAGEVARRDPPVLTAEDDLNAALKLMRAEHEEHVPVVADRERRTLVGFVHERDVLVAYNRALLEQRAEAGG